MTEQFEQLLRGECREIGVELSDTQVTQFFQYFELLVQWNQVMNLTAITEMGDVVTKHFVDSLLLNQKLLQIKTSQFYCIDVGTGAGFPGIPLKIAFPQLEVVLLDSLNKRVGFLNEVTEKLGLSGITAVHGRAEDFGRDPKYREQFDLCVSRAVANLSTLAEYCMPFVKKGGMFVSYKSGKAGEEIAQAKKAVHVLGGEIDPQESVLLPGTDVERTFVIIKKLGITPKKYPRKAGVPGKTPIQ